MSLSLSSLRFDSVEVRESRPRLLLLFSKFSMAIMLMACYEECVLCVMCYVL